MSKILLKIASKKTNKLFTCITMQTFLLLLLCAPVQSSELKLSQPSPIRIAFLADIHLHDIYAHVPNAKISKLLPKKHHLDRPLLMRSMSAQLGSTRLFNENYFVFKAALDDLVEKNVKLVALPGDFTDDGQPINVQAVAKLLDKYAEQYDMQFFTITGNHDPVRPFTVPGGKSNFLQKNGQELAIYSQTHPKCLNKHSAIAIASTKCTNIMQYWGYAEIMATLASHGFSPQSQYLYYETPFSKSTVNDWSFETSLAESKFEQRQLHWCQDQSSKCINIPDASYLVEPVNGLWLLAIDANVYKPKESNGSSLTYEGSSGAGYNAMSEFKQPILDWVSSVVKRAKQQNKQLVAFSHYPMTDFYDDASADIQSLFGEQGFQMKRMPNKDTENLLANTGLQLHFAGHMHINDTGTAKSATGSVLFNIQVPSLAAYQPAYKLLTLPKNGTAKVQTIVLNDVPNYDDLFPHYLKEWRYRDKNKLPNWDKRVLNSKTYAELTDQHLQGVVNQRYLPKEWPTELVKFLQGTNSHKLFALAQCKSESILDTKTEQTKLSDMIGDKINGQTIIYDLYRIRNADHISSVPASRQAIYLKLNSLMQNCWQPQSSIEIQVTKLFQILEKMINSETSADFIIDLIHNSFVE